MTSPFNLATFDSVYNFSVLQNQYSHQQKLQHHFEAISNNTFDPTFTSQQQQHQQHQTAAVTAAAQLAYVQHHHPSYIYSYPSPPLDSNNYSTTSSYPSSTYPQSTMDRRTSLNAGLVPSIHQLSGHGKVVHQLSPPVDGNSSDATAAAEPWRTPVVMADNTGNPFSFGHHSTAPMGYFGQHPVGYDRNVISHFANAMPPTPQDYPITMGLTSPNANGSRNPSQFQPNPQRPRPVTPQDMMTTFSSKTVSSTPKRYKCNVCQKRFTRPSSLQTHTYSHTGEKPFKCPVEGCGRHFSVVSNLRRHQKIHSK